MSLAGKLLENLSKIHESGSREEMIKAAHKRNKDRIGKPGINPKGEEIPDTIILSEYTYASKQDGKIQLISTDPFEWKNTTILLTPEQVKMLNELL